jgi:hypothetical protein
MIVTGVAYYTKEAYAQLLQDAGDRIKLCDTYEEWLQVYERSIKNMRKEGIETHPYVMDMMELKAWCKAHRLPNTGKSRARFVSEKMSAWQKPD